jgi:hypothetical protein
VRLLTRLDTLFKLEGSAVVELESVGADHDVEDYGRDVSKQVVVSTGKVDEHDHSQRCCICLDAYDTDAQPGFQIDQCSHIIGKSYLATWLNSTSQNSNLCPQCRSKLCERRSRRPAPMDPAITAEMEREMRRLTLAKSYWRTSKTCIQASSAHTKLKNRGGMSWISSLTV